METGVSITCTTALNGSIVSVLKTRLTLSSSIEHFLSATHVQPIKVPPRTSVHPSPSNMKVCSPWPCEDLKGVDGSEQQGPVHVANQAAGASLGLLLPCPHHSPFRSEGLSGQIVS